VEPLAIQSSSRARSNNLERLRRTPQTLAANIELINIHEPSAPLASFTARLRYHLSLRLEDFGRKYTRIDTFNQLNTKRSCTPTRLP